MNSASFRRLAKDHAALHNTELPPYYLFAPSNGGFGPPDDLTQLTIYLAGPQGTPYADGLWKLHLRMPQDYPKSPPKAYFKTKIWHPNVEESNGSVCLDTLKRDWESKLTLKDILVTISCLLINPNPDSALNAAAGKLLQENWDAFASHARLMTSIHASVPFHLRRAVSDAQSRGDENKSSTSNSPEEPGPTAPRVEVNEDSEDEEDNSKENDSSLSPSPVDPNPPAPIRRPTVLGKRPLGELPTPDEPPSDDEGDSNQRNIAANTPQLSQGLSNLSFSSIPASASASASASTSTSIFSDANLLRRSPKLTERVRGTNFASFPPTLARPGRFDFSSRAVSMCEASLSSSSSSSSSSLQPKAKRVCSDEGKENDQENEPARAASVQPKPTPLIGLGLRASSSAPASRKGSGMGPGGLKGKARIGMRRL